LSHKVNGQKEGLVLLEAAAFRHDPKKSVLVIEGKAHHSARWLKEPAVCGYRQLSHQSKALGQEIPVPVCATPAVVTGAGVLVASYDGRVCFYSRNLDKVFWERRLDSPIYASLIVDPRRRAVIAAATSGLVACFDLRGSLLWSATTQVPIYATPTALLASDVLVIAAFHSRCIGLELGTGRKVFDHSLPEPWYSAYGGSAAHRDPYASPTATESGDAVVCCAEDVLCFAPDGTLRWRQAVGQCVRASPVALHATGEVAVGTVGGRCIFLDSGTGQERGEVVLGAKITASPAVSGNVLAIGTADDEAYGLDIRRREIVWHCSRGAPLDHSSFTVMPDGNFIATSSRGNIVGRCRNDGRFLWETSQLLGLPDHNPAMDITPMAGRDGSMYCGSYSGVIYHFRFQPVDGELQ
jgi:outer membrane protein assembly factor BamB